MRSFRNKIHKRKFGLTLVETLITGVIITMVGISAIISIIFMREYAEYDKQRIAAISFARKFVEETRSLTFPAIPLGEDRAIDNFNTPNDAEDDLSATAVINAYVVDSATGAVDFTNDIDPPITTDNRVLVRVSVSWNRTGRLSVKRVTEVLDIYYGPGT